jgi:putative heme-binding domain-containing protein
LSTELDEADRLAAVTALGFVPTREAALALLDIAEKGEGLVQKHSMWWLLNYRGTRWDGDGIDEELKWRGLYDPETVVISASIVPEPLPSEMPPIAEIAALKGDVARGGEKVVSCFLCHRVGEDGVDYGPDLTTWASNQTTEVAINAIVNPSSDIAHGFGGNLIALKDRTIIHGIIESQGDPLVVRSMGGLVQMIPADRVASVHRFSRSLMLNAEQLGLSPQDVADIVAYLQSL